ncbi:GTPase IMAP family member 7-like [Ruditapes philippinarum]|uniref:GTPase IMAP family member 7-like n=1 Tax=Ruditapes philippinarum TaxID=129788 RepID=UPI00295BDFE1|nr:GTPase IMAP family member 7-like [Ruditapes philippinarum]
MTPINGLKIIIVGKTGNGKSSLGNTLLQGKVFFESDDFNAATAECQLEQNIPGLTVVDTPGLFGIMETDKNVKQIRSNALSIIRSLDICCQPHAFLFTLNGACRFTDEELSVIDVLTIIFGKEWIDHAIVIVTHIGNDVKESDFKKKWNRCEKLKKFVKDCNGRICRIDNRNPQEEHVSRILHFVNQVSLNGKRPYSAKYIDCRKKVLQNEDKLEEYNGMPSHLIIKEIAQDIQTMIANEIKNEELHRRLLQQEKEEKEKLAKLAAFEMEKKISKTVSTITASGLSAASVACIAYAASPFAIAFCCGGAVVAIGISIFTWRRNL